MDSDASAEATVPLGDNPSGDRSGGEVRTFLIADVRGYTRFTQERGDEEAALLAERLAGLVREVVATREGEVIELRGDEALAVFTSARQALRAAVDLQRRSRADIDNGSFPLGIGVGLDAGEAIPLEGGYRGGALNLASRLCGLAAPGQILVSETVVGLAGRVDGIPFVKRRPARLKGLDSPVPVIEAAPEPPLPPVPSALAARRMPIRRRPRLLAAALAATIAVAVAVPLALRSGHESSPLQTVVTVPRSFVGLVRIDPRTNKVVQRVRLPGDLSNGSTTFAAGSLWIAGSTGVDRVDPRTGKILARIPIHRRGQWVGGKSTGGNLAREFGG